MRQIKDFLFLAAWLAFGFAIVLSITVINLQSSERYQHCIEQGQQKAQQTTPQNESPHFLIPLIITKRCLGDYAQAYSPAITAILTIVLAGATLGLWFVSWGGIRGQRRETRILQRAYIGAEPGGVSVFQPRDLAAPATNQTFVGHTVFRNAGRLPARNVRWYTDAEYTTDPDYEPIKLGKLTGNNVISPGEAMTQGSFEKDIPEHRGYFFVWGKIVYDDGFGRERKTIFCHRYNCRRLERGEGADSGFFRIRDRYGRHHNKGNDAD